VRQFVKSIARQEVMLRMADSAGITISADERTGLVTEFKSVVGSLWQQLNLDPRALTDSARSVPERERLAAARVEAYMDRILSGQAQPISVPPPVAAVLSSKYDSKTYPAGIDRALERARQLRAATDSTRAAQQPRSQVPLPTPPPATQPDAPATKRP